MPPLPAIDCPPHVENLVWVYILQTSDGTFYLGQSCDVRERLRNHQLGLGSTHTADHREPRLVYAEGPVSLNDAVAREQQLKRWSRAKKDALIRGDFERLRALSRSREPSKLAHDRRGRMH